MPAAGSAQAPAAGRQATAAAPVPVSAPAVAATPAAAPVPANAATPATAPAAPPIDYAAASPHFGVPDGSKGIQPQVTAIGQRAEAFHNGPLLLMCAVISLFVLLLLGYTMVKFRRGANPTPSRTSHNTTIEVIWTVVPVLILVAIAIPSIRLIRAQYSPPPADVTIKVVGNQWYWTYQYPDNGGIEIVSNMLKEQKDVKPGERFRTDADGPPLLAADERMVIPVGKVVKFIITSTDVIHSFAVPAFWTKMDANPGRLNETWVKVDRPGVYFGQCSELCGARHGFMPIAVEVVPEATFNAWLASKGGTPKGVKPSTEKAPAEAVAASPANDTTAIEQPALNQAATAQNN
ncbi:MAG: cytochrome c oxidase subunit II [Sphingomonas sp.]|nr:cytochrome c oxidase subunit II [Sphingomonas sp.]